MKGLLLKDLYMMRKYCKSYIRIVLLFVAATFASGENMLFAFFPCFACGMIPINLLSYDERSRWMQYSETMPYTKAQIVSGKYLIGLGAQVVVMLITGIVQAIRMCTNGTFIMKDFFIFMILLLVVSMFASSITFPFIFKFGVEKGRMAFNFLIGLVMVGSFLIVKMFPNGVQIDIKGDVIFLIICIIGIGWYILSWYLSIVFYKKREENL